MKRLATIMLLFSLAYVTVAQTITVQHRCWDIVTEMDDGMPEVLVPMMTTAVDSGAMLVALSMKYIGTPYRYGGRTPKAFDCAGFACYLYKQFGYSLPGWSGAQARLGIEVSDTRNLRAGDLVFFGGRGAKKVVGHTGIVVDTGLEIARELDGAEPVAESTLAERVRRQLVLRLPRTREEQRS